MGDNRKYFNIQILSIMIGFFVVGSIEMVGIASNYIKVNLHISDAKANLLPSLVYIWFFIITIPAGLLMHRIGREKSVMLSMIVMAVSMIFPIFISSYPVMLLSFIILGIGNVSLQTSLYPLLSDTISGKGLAVNLTLGQFIKTLSSFSAPYIAMLGSVYLTTIKSGLSWRVLFVIYLIITLFSMIMMSVSKFDSSPLSEDAPTFRECIKLLRKPVILLSFIGVMCHVGIDISTNTVAPKLLMYRLGMVIDKASFGASLYFIARLAGCFFWTFFLKKVNSKSFFLICVLIITGALTWLFFADSKVEIFTCIVLIGFGNANLFPVLLSQAIINIPGNKDVISVLMIMGQSGGALFPFSMGLALDHLGMNGSLSILMIGALYLLFYAFKTDNHTI